LFLVNTVLERAVINPAVRLTTNETFDSRWFAFHCATGALSDLAARVRRGILQRIGPRTARERLSKSGILVAKGSI
jgi:hypothetical protein